MDALVFKMKLCMYIMTSHYNKTFYYVFGHYFVKDMKGILIKHGRELHGHLAHDLRLIVGL